MSIHKSKRNHWMVPQIEALSLGIRARLPYHIMADAMGRSVESVRKASERHLGHLLTVNNRGKKIDRDESTFLPKAQFLLAVESQCRRRHYRLEAVLSPEAIEQLRALPKRPLLEWTLAPREDSDGQNPPRSPKGKGRQSLPKILTMDDLCRLLARSGHRIKTKEAPIHSKRGQEKFYSIDGHLKTAGEILLGINRKRTEKGLFPLYIEDVTEF